MANVDTLKLLGSLLGNGALAKGSSANVLESVLGAVLGANQNQAGGGLSALLGSVVNTGQPQQNRQQAGGLGGLLGAAAAKPPQQSAGLADLLGAVMGAPGQSQAPQQTQQHNAGAGLGGLLGTALKHYAQSQQGVTQKVQPAAQQHSPRGQESGEASAQATVLIRAMVNAAKADGQFDAQEQQTLLAKLGNVSQDEVNFIKSELAQPLDVDAFARTVPKGLEQQVYAISLMAITLDTQAEAMYLDKLARGLGISQKLSNQIHQQLGVVQLYS